MWATIISAVVFALALCADSFAVATCSAVTMQDSRSCRAGRIGLIFGLIQAGLLLCGYLLGDLLLWHVMRAAGWLALGILLLVGGSMIRSGLRGGDDSRRLDSLVAIILGGLATSMDALAVGVSLSLGRIPGAEMAADALAVFLTTVLSVVVGIRLGQRIGRRFAGQAEIAGGLVLIVLGIKLLVNSF